MYAIDPFSGTSLIGSSGGDAVEKPDYPAPSEESLSELNSLISAPSLRAGPDLGGDIDGGGSTGIGRDEDIPIPGITWENILLFFILYCLVEIIKRRKYSER